MEVESHDIDETTRYEVHPHHRNNTPEKSQWVITAESEVECFRRTHTEEWTEQHAAWGLHLEEGKASVLGTSAVTEGDQRQLAIAKFVRARDAEPWHGYPADILRRQKDAPPEAVKFQWLAQGLVEPQKLRKLARGEQCAL